MVEVVVKARFGFSTPYAGSYEVLEGDIGVLKWERHPRYTRLIEPLVVWDHDPSRTPHSAVHSAIEVIGLQIDQHRILVVPVTLNTQ